MFTKILQPSFDITIPSTGKKVPFRPFLEKERKILLMALESETETDVLKNIFDLLLVCCLDTSFQIEKLPIFDVEYCFLQLRAKSIGEIIQPTFRCENVVNENTCGAIITLDIDLTALEVSGIDKPKRIILTPELAVGLKYPNLEDSILLSSKNNITDHEFAYSMIASCIDYVIDRETIYPAKEASPEELNEFLLSLTLPQFKQLEDFFINLPMVKYKNDHTCQKCGFTHHIVLEGYESFFV